MFARKFSAQCGYILENPNFEVVFQYNRMYRVIPALSNVSFYCYAFILLFEHVCIYVLQSSVRSNQSCACLVYQICHNTAIFTSLESIGCRFLAICVLLGSVDKFNYLPALGYTYRIIEKQASAL